MTATLAQQIAAKNDGDLIERIAAAAETLGIDNARMWAEQHRGRVVLADVEGTNLATVHAYAVATYNPPPRPGQNPAAVTDSQIISAVSAVKAAQGATVST